MPNRFCSEYFGCINKRMNPFASGSSKKKLCLNMGLVHMANPRLGFEMFLGFDPKFPKNFSLLKLLKNLKNRNNSMLKWGER